MSRTLQVCTGYLVGTYFDRYWDLQGTELVYLLSIRSVHSMYLTHTWYLISTVHIMNVPNNYQVCTRRLVGTQPGPEQA